MMAVVIHLYRLNMQSSVESWYLEHPDTDLLKIILHREAKTRRVQENALRIASTYLSHNRIHICGLCHRLDELADAGRICTPVRFLATYC